jgi:hypothetical protein
MWDRLLEIGGARFDEDVREGSQIGPKRDTGLQSYLARPGIGIRAIVAAMGDLNLGLAAGFGLITISLIVLVSGLLWSATRRLRNLPDDPPILRRLIVAGLAGAGVGVVVAALAVATG